jgi:hypothetical protein
MKTAEPTVALFSEEEAIEANVDGHTANRTNMPPWESCGPDCPVCGDCEN